MPANKTQKIDLKKLAKWVWAWTNIRYVARYAEMYGTVWPERKKYAPGLREIHLQKLWALYTMARAAGMERWNETLERGAMRILARAYKAPKA